MLLTVHSKITCGLLIACWHIIIAYQVELRKSRHLQSIRIYRKPISTHTLEGIPTSITNNCTTRISFTYSISIEYLPHFSHLQNIMEACTVSCLGWLYHTHLANRIARAAGLVIHSFLSWRPSLSEEEHAVCDVEENSWQSYRWREHPAECSSFYGNSQCMGWSFETCESKVHNTNSHPNELS